MKKKSYKIACLIAAIMVAVIGIGVFVTTRMENLQEHYIDRASQDHIHEIIGLSCRPYAAQLERSFESLRQADRFLTMLSDDRRATREEIFPYIGQLRSIAGFDRILFMDSHCSYLSGIGERGMLDVTADLINLFDRHEPLVRFLNWRDGQSRFTIAVPTEPFYIDGKEYAVLVALLTPDYMNDLFASDSYGNAARIYVLENTGEVVFTNQPEVPQGTNHLSELRSEGILTPEQTDQIKDDFHQAVSGSLKIDVDGVSTHFCYEPVGDTQYNVLMEVPTEVAARAMKGYSRLVSWNMIAVFGLLALAVLAAVILLANLRRTRALSAQQAESNRALEHANVQLSEAKVGAEAANRAKSTFLSNMSHDIRTPLNAIIGYTNLATSNIDDRTKVEDCLAKIDRSSAHLLSLINDVLDMSRIESGKITITPEPVNLREIVRNMAELVHSGADAKDIHLTADADGLKHAHVLCDRVHLNQVLQNILSNAIKYTQQSGHVTFTVSERPGKSTNRSTYIFVVKDNGMGMTPEFVQNIFEPFARANNSTVSGIQGTGLGMSIAKNIVDLMGGTITVASEYTKGTSITVVLSLEHAAEVQKVEVADVIDYDFTGCRILLVDDNEMNREIAQVILESSGFEIDTADDGTVALEKMTHAAAGDYDAVLMDVQMPLMNGYEATRRIRALGTEISRIPILAMTANAFEEDRREALAAGMDEHLTKPIDGDKVKATLARFLKG